MSRALERTAAKLERCTAASGLAWYRSPTLSALGVPHAFLTRRGPVRSELDLRRIEPAHLPAFVPALADANEPTRQRTLLALRQVHGDTVIVAGSVELDSAEPPHAALPALTGRGSVPGAGELPAGDALFAARDDCWLAVRTADCVPILIAALDGSRVAAVHAGWRGLVAGVIRRAAEHFAGRPFAAAVGPCLSLARFEVGPEVALAFEQAGHAACVQRLEAWPRPHVDLRAAAWAELQSAGARAIDTTDRCTWEHADDFFSHRRDVTHGPHARAGHQAAVIGARSDVR